MIGTTLPDCIQNYLQGMDSKKVIIGFSGGPDSVTTYQLISSYYQSQGRDRSLIYLAYFNHRFRPESDEEQTYIENNYSQLLVGVYHGGTYKEHELREARHTFFQQCLQKIDTTTLILGHQLNDRIETTLLNIQRGAGLTGRINMRMIDQKDGYMILRPLLNTTKTDILQYCAMQGVSYFIDPTNDDEKISQRNAIRKTLSTLSQLEFESYRSQYHIRENEYDQIPLPWRKIELPYYSGFDALYEIESTLTLEQLVKILKSIHCYEGVTKRNLQDLYDFIISDYQGKKFRGSRVWYRTHGRVFLVHPNNQFNTGQMISFRLEYDKKIIGIIGGTQGKKYGGKPISKYCINKKIPLFLRALIPIDEHNKPYGQLILQVLSHELF